MIAFSIVGALLFALFIILLLRYAKPGPWTHRDVLAFIALIVTCGGAMALTFLKARQNDVFVAQADRLITELVRERKDQINGAIGDVLKEIISTQSTDILMNSAGVLVVLLSLGLVIGVRTFKGRLPGGAEFEMGGGENAEKAAAEAARATAGAAVDEAERIADGELPEAKPGAGELPEAEKLK